MTTTTKPKTTRPKAGAQAEETITLRLVPLPEGQKKAPVQRAVEALVAAGSLPEGKGAVVSSHGSAASAASSASRLRKLFPSVEFRAVGVDVVARPIAD